MLVGLALIIVKFVAKLAWHYWPVTLAVVAAAVGLMVWRKIQKRNDTEVQDFSE